MEQQPREFRDGDMCGNYILGDSWDTHGRPVAWQLVDGGYKPVCRRCVEAHRERCPHEEIQEIPSWARPEKPPTYRCARCGAAAATREALGKSPG
jgi:hypothetical protein